MPSQESAQIMLRDAVPDDVPALLDIHNFAVRDLDAIWTETEETLEQRTIWLHERRAAGFPVIVATNENGDVLGYGTFGPYRPKDGYRLTVEHSVYVAQNAQGQGIGKALLCRLIDIARDQGKHLMIAVIDAKNAASKRLHEQLGFQLIGHLPEAGVKHGRWLSQVQMYLKLDDRQAPPAD